MRRTSTGSSGAIPRCPDTRDGIRTPPWNRRGRKLRGDLASDGPCHSWVIRRDEEFVGIIGAYDFDPEGGSIEIRYSIARRFWGHGHARSVVRAVVAFLLEQPEISTIRAWSHVDNVASLRVQRGAGFREAGVDGEHLTFQLSVSDRKAD